MDPELLNPGNTAPKPVHTHSYARFSIGESMFWRERWRDSGTQMPKPVSDFLTMCEYNPNTTHSTTNIWMFLKQEVILNPRNNKRLLAEFVDALEKLIKRESEEKSERDIFEIKKRKG